MQQRRTRGDELACARQRLRKHAIELGEPERDRFHARAQYVDGPSTETQTDNRAARIVRPAGAALATPERQDRQAVGIGLHRGERSIYFFGRWQMQARAQPGQEGATVLE